MIQNTVINPFFAGLFQIGFVTKDIDKAIEFLSNTMGTGKFFKMDLPEVREQTWNDKPIQIKVNLVFGQWGKMNIELIQPIES